MARKTTASLAVVGAMALTALGFTATAAAHTPVLSAVCVDGSTKLSVDITGYDADKPNKIAVSDNGDKLVETSFGSKYHQTWEKLDGKIGHRFLVTVQAWDDPDGKRGWSFSKEVEAAACVQTTTTTTPPATTTTPAATTTTSQSSVATTTPSETTAPVVTTSTPAPPLAATGATTTWGLISGLVLVGAGSFLLLFLRRKRA